MNYHLNNLVNKTKTIVPFNSQIITSENYIKTEKIIADSGNIIYGGATNIQFLADTNTVLSGNSGPLIQMYGAGGQNASVGLNLDTFQSLQSIKGGRKNGINPATQILAVDNGQYSSDLVFNTAPPSQYDSYLPACEERMKITANGNVSINNNLTVNGEITVDGIVNINNNIVAKNLYLNDGTTNSLPIWNEIISGTTTGNLLVDSYAVINNAQIQNVEVAGSCRNKQLFVGNEGATINGPLTVLLGWNTNLNSLTVNNPIELNYQPSSVINLTSEKGYQIGVTNTLGCMIGATLPGTTFDGLYNIFSISTSSTVLTNIGSLTLDPNGVYTINLNVKINPISNAPNYINIAQFYLSSESSLTDGILKNSINCGSFYNNNFNSYQNDTYINLTVPYNTSYYQNYYNNLGLDVNLNANIIYLWSYITYYGTSYSVQFNVIYNATRCG
jgi:hypothetical protein